MAARSLLLRHQRRYRLLWRLASPSRRCLSSDVVPISRTLDLYSSTKIEGEESQVAIVDIKEGETLRAESGNMLYMTSGIQMETTAGKGAFSRFVTGQSLFVSDFTGEGQVALGTDFPSKIVKLNLQDYHDSQLICQRGAYLASGADVDIEMEFTKKFSTGFFGGEGFVLQKLSGQGTVLIKAGGTLVKRELKEGETLRVSSGSLVAFESSVNYDITTMPGFKNVLFGGEGLFVTTLTGPGTVWLQGMPPDRMISEIARRVPQGMGFGIPIGIGGGSSDTSSDEAAEADAGEAGEGVGGEQDVAATATAASQESAIEADRQATVASSGIMGDDDTAAVDSESPSALFGDAAGAQQDNSAAAATDDGFQQDTFQQNDAFSTDNQTDSFQQQDTTFEQDSTFGSQDSFGSDDTQFGGDFEDSTSFSTGSDSPTGGDEEGGSSILQTLWDLFTGDD